MRKTLILLAVVFIRTLVFADDPNGGFEIDKVLRVGDATSDLHYHVYVPSSYDGKDPYALYITLPGYGGIISRLLA